MLYSLTEVADHFGKTANSIRHIVQEQNISIKGGITEDSVALIQQHLDNMKADYERRGVLPQCPDGYILSSQDIHVLTGKNIANVGKLCRSGLLDGVLVETRNGASWFVREESLERYMRLNNLPKQSNHEEVIALARFDRFKEHLFSSEKVVELSERLGCTKEEAIEIAIDSMIKEAI